LIGDWRASPPLDLHPLLAHHQERAVEAVVDAPRLLFLPGLGRGADDYPRRPPTEWLAAEGWAGVDRRGISLCETHAATSSCGGVRERGGVEAARHEREGLLE
jgi:hypothetical protein